MSKPDPPPQIFTSSPPTSNAPLRQLRVSYGATTTVPDVPLANGDHSGSENGYCDDDDCEDCVDLALERPIYPLSWRYMSRLYLLVPIITFIFFLGLVALVTWGWPPNRDERKTGQAYPHPIFWKAFLVGVFASATIQALRVPTFIAVSWLPFGGQTVVVLSTVVHTVLHEATRLVSVPLTIPSPTSGFHSSFYLGLGWGVSQTAWGIVQAWEQLCLYEDVLTDAPEDVTCWDDGESGLTTVPEDQALLTPEDAMIQDEEDAAELASRVEILERMRARHELEEVMGIPFPLIPLPMHVLWRLDTLLLNLGLTLILASFYFDSEPIYRHDLHATRDWPPAAPNKNPSKWLPLAWALVTAVHIVLNLVWQMVGRVGVGAVTWGGLIVGVGSVFAGLGTWGGLV